MSPAIQSKFFRTLTVLLQGHLPGQVVIQLTDRCNASCPQCGMRVSADFPRSTLSVDHLKRTIDYAAAHNIQALSITGGEPLLMLDTVAELLRYAGKVGIRYLRTGTNGYFFRDPDAKNFLSRVQRVANTLADTPLRNLWISLDSAIPETHEQMRGFKGIVAGIEKALPLFHHVGIYPAANLGINRGLNGTGTLDLRPQSFNVRTAYLDAFYHAFCTGLHRFFEQVERLGFTMSNLCYPMSVGESGETELGAVYAATASDRIISFEDDEKGMLFSALLDTIPKFRSRLRIFSPCVSLYMLKQYYTHRRLTQYPCRGGFDFLFISAQDGNAYPCGYRGRNKLGPLWQMDPASLDPEPKCIACDWECFRDPSELFGPLSDLFTRPWRAIKNFFHDPTYFRLWRRDLKYFKACSYFDGRIPPNPSVLQKFSSGHCS